MNQTPNNTGNLFTVKSNTPPNPDAVHNINLLQSARLKFAIDIFTKHFRKSYVVLMETLFYSGTMLLLGIGFIVYFEISRFIDLAKQTNHLPDAIITDPNTDAYVSVTQYLLLSLLLLPSLLSFLLAISYTKSRKRIGTLIEVEKIIETVVYNLKCN